MDRLAGMPPRRFSAYRRASLMDLAVVMPVYNEEACIAGVVRSWRDLLDTLQIEYRLIVLNDGSKDGSATALAAFGDNPRIEVVNKPNAGHGPTILFGYRRAVKIAEWCFSATATTK
jgi:glycosyltransferase involved in cell wall biosynthesis